MTTSARMSSTTTTVSMNARRRSGKRGPTPLPQLAQDELPARLEPDDEKEERHQPAVHPLAKIQRNLSAAQVDRQRRPPEPAVGRRVDVHPYKCRDRRREQNSRAAGLGAQELAQRRPHTPRPRRSSRERRLPSVRIAATARSAPPLPVVLRWPAARATYATVATRSAACRHSAWR